MKIHNKQSQGSRQWYKQQVKAAKDRQKDNRRPSFPRWSWSNLKESKSSPFKLLCALWWLNEASEASFPYLQDKKGSRDSLMGIERFHLHHTKPHQERLRNTLAKSWTFSFLCVMKFLCLIKSDSLNFYSFFSPQLSIHLHSFDHH